MSRCAPLRRSLSERANVLLLLECTRHYDEVLAFLHKTYDIKHFALDNVCLYEKHYKKKYPGAKLKFVVPMMHVKGHGLV